MNQDLDLLMNLNERATVWKNHSVAPVWIAPGSPQGYLLQQLFNKLRCSGSCGRQVVQLADHSTESFGNSRCQSTLGDGEHNRYQDSDERQDSAIFSNTLSRLVVDEPINHLNLLEQIRGHILHVRVRP